MRVNGARAAFTLIELLLVVAIIGAVLGGAVAYYDDHLTRAEVAKVKQDLDTLRAAIGLYELDHGKVVGTDVRQLVGKNLQAVPTDPWEAPYLLDASLGIVWTYGADAKPGGEGRDADQLFEFRPRLQLSKVEYDGPFGVPRAGSTLVLKFTKPFSAATQDAVKHVILIRNPASVSAAQKSRGPLSGPSAPWSVGAASNPGSGLLVLVRGTAPAGSDSTPAQVLGPTMAIDLDDSAYLDLAVSPYEDPGAPAENSAVLRYPKPSARPTAAWMPQYYPGYPDGYAETGASPCEGRLGTRIERR